MAVAGRSTAAATKIAIERIRFIPYPLYYFLKGAAVGFPMARCPDLLRVSVVGVSSLFGRRGLFRYQRGHGAIVLSKIFLRHFFQIIFCDLVIAVNGGGYLGISS